jgi:hypothetical protein
MKGSERSRSFLAVALLVVAIVSMAPLHSSQDPPKPPQARENLANLHDFDFLVGQWQVRHRRLKERLAGSHEWIEFDGTLSMRQFMDGRVNVDDDVFNVPGGAWRGVALRAYDPKSARWSIWWVDSRNPSANLDPPMKGQFENSIGTFYADDTLRGKPIKVRFIWSHKTPSTARWEQAYSPDGGKTWETNWTQELRRVR